MRFWTLWHTLSHFHISLNYPCLQAAGAIIIEVRRQFAEIPGLREGNAEADSDKCVAISTQSSVEEMILPGIYAILSPITVGLLIGPKCLTGMLGGAIASGMMLAIMMANAGGAWDNSKKYIEIEGACGGKGTDRLSRGRARHFGHECSANRSCPQGDYHPAGPRARHGDAVA